MKRKLNCILLIDDDEPTNVFHQMVIEEAGCAETVVSVESGPEALNYLESKVDGEHPQPALIFLDINMPDMNGWEFLEEYNKLESKMKGDIVFIMLTTSLNPKDKETAESIPTINGFSNKPLTVESLTEMVKEHFPDHF